MEIETETDDMKAETSKGGIKDAKTETETETDNIKVRDK